MNLNRPPMQIWWTNTLLRLRNTDQWMTDTVKKGVRSKIMARIRGKNTSPEKFLRKALFAAGSKYRLQYPVKGRPDIVFPKEKVAVFVDGCFWHGCVRCARLPKSNVVYWTRKIASNVKRDSLVNQELKKTGWRVLRIPEHNLNERRIKPLVSRITSIVRKRRKTRE